MATTTSTTTTTSPSETRHYKKGEHYVELSHPVKQVPRVIVFFSFLDPVSKDWALRHDVTNTIRRNMPMGVEVSRYHTSASYPNDFSRDLNHAWAVAKYLQIDDRLIEPLFEAIYGETRISDVQGIKAVFDHIGIPPLRLDKEYNKTAVVSEADWMEECRDKMGIEGIPAVVVGGRYLVKTEALGSEPNADLIADVVKELLELQR